MANTDSEKFSKGYGEKAYKHATKEGKEDWTREDEETKDLRMVEYKKRLDKFKSRFALQKLTDLKNVDSKYTFKKGDTLYPVLTEFYGMNRHTAFFALVRMLENGINVDLWYPDDEIILKTDGTLVAKRKGAEVTIENFLSPTAKRVETALQPEVQPQPKAQVEKGTEVKVASERQETQPTTVPLSETQETRSFTVEPPKTQETPSFTVEPPKT